MTTPEEAAELAAERARERRASGEYADADELEALAPLERPSLERLREWAVIDVRPEVAVSTRRLGGPITLFKRFLLRMLLQYHNEVTAQTTRFNLHLLGYAAALDDRVAELERRVEELERR